jgi:transcriptional antiterminator RfaH
MGLLFDFGVKSKMAPVVQKIGLRRRGKPVKEQLTPAALGNNHAECGSHGLPWYVVQVHRAQLILATRNMQRQGFLTYTPLVETPRKDKPPAWRPLFPGYSFVSFDEEARRWQVLFSSYGVKKVLMTDTLRPVQLPGSVLHLAQHPTSEFQICEAPSPKYQPGQRLKINTGPFLGHTGTLLDWSDETRCRLLVALLNREIEIQVPYKQVTEA